LLRKASQEGSTRQLDELLEKYPQSRLADEALHLLAKLPGREGHEATVRRLFEQYPQSGYCDEAAWEVLRYLTGNYYSLGSLRQPAEQIRILSQYLQHRPTGELAPLFRAHRGHLRLWTEADFTGAAEDLREAIKMIEKVERLPLVPPKMALQKARNDLAQITSELGESPAPPPAEEGLSADEVSARAQQHLEAGRPLQALRAYRLALEKARESTEQAWLKLSLAELFLRVSLPLEEVESWLKEIVEPLRGTHVTIVEPLRGTHVADEVRFLLEEVQMARGHFSDAAHFSIVFPGRALPMPTDRRGRALNLSGYVREHTDGPSDPARNAYEQVLREFPTSPWADWARFRLGCLAAAEGHFAQAAAEYQQLLERDLAPELRLEVLAALAYAQLEQGNVEEAAKTLQSAPEATPSVAAVMILLRARQGENERVLEEGERFLVAHPYHDYAAAVGLARAEVLRAWQRTEEAQQQLYQASHAYPPPRLLRILQERLQTLPLPPPRPPSPVESRWATWAARYRLLPELQDEDGRALQQLAGRFLEKRTGKAPEADRFVVTDLEYDALKARAVVFFQTGEAGYRLEAVWRDGRWIVTQARMEWIA
jgi:tetratricopeptide (TPR) repeat protein